MNNQYKTKISRIFPFVYFILQGKSFQNTPKNANVTVNIKKLKTFSNTLNWWNWRSFFVKLVVNISWTRYVKYKTILDDCHSFVCNRGYTIQYHGELQTRKLGQAPILVNTPVFFIFLSLLNLKYNTLGDIVTIEFYVRGAKLSCINESTEVDQIERHFHYVNLMAKNVKVYTFSTLSK